MEICKNCGKAITTKTVYSYNGMTYCRSCQLNALRIKKFGSIEAYKKHMLEAQKKTLNEKYGVDNARNIQGVEEKIKNTVKERYGVDHVFKNKDIKEKRDNTFINKYGTKDILSSPLIREKIESTNKERYGSINPLNNEEIKEKAKKTMFERYGVEHNFQDGILRERMKEGFIKRYETSVPSKSNIIKNKTKETCLDRYGVENVNQSDVIKNKVKNTIKEKRNSKEHLDWRISVAENNGFKYLSQYIREDNETVIKFRCPRCNKEFDWCFADDSRHVMHHDCHYSVSNMEIEIRDFIRSILKDDNITNDRTILKGKELDIYIPYKNIAIEFDGLYWHNNIDNSWKFNECNKLGVRLIRINEYEWTHYRNKIENYLRSVFGIYNRRIYARECQVREITSEESKKFLECNHLQGNVNSSIRLGLFYNNELVEVETFGKSRFDKNFNGYELLRECSLMGVNIVGGKSKLLKYFIRNYNPTSIISYCERDKFSGKSYESCGFKLVSISKPSYKYYKDDKEYSRIKFQKHKLKNLLDIFNNNLTEWDNMKNNGYSRLFDYGNYVYIMK